MGKERVIVKTDEDLSQVADSAAKLKLVNRDLTAGCFVKELGLDVTQRGEQVPESGSVPGMFLLKDGKISTLAENDVEVGSQKFWQEAAQGHLFGYPAGERHPVQIQLYNPTSYAGNKVQFSAPLDPKKMPPTENSEKAPRAPRWYHRLFRWGNNRRLCQAYDSYVARQKELDTQAREKAEAIEKAFGDKRTPEVLEAEKVTAKELRENFAEHRAMKASKSALSIKQHDVGQTKRMAERGLEIYGPKPVQRDELTQADKQKPNPKHKGKLYTQQQFDSLKPIDLKGAQVGGKTVTNREFAALALGAGSDPKVGREVCRTIGGDAEPLIKPIVAAGYEQEEAEAMVTEALREMYGRTLLVDRDGTGVYFPDVVQPAREKAQAALQAYQAGDKAPMAEILSRMVQNLGDEMCCRTQLDDDLYAQNRMAGDALDMMERDPELKEMARQKYEQNRKKFHDRHPQYHEGRSFEEQIGSIRQGQEMDRLKTESLKAQNALLEARINGTELTAEEKHQHAKAILKYNVLHHRYVAESNMYTTGMPNEMNGEYRRMEKEAEKLPNDTVVKQRQDVSSTQTTTPKSAFRGYMEGHIKVKPAVMDDVTDPKRMAELDAGLENLIAKEGLDKRSTRQLSDTLAEGVRDTGQYTTEKLMNKLIDANPRVQKQSEGPQLQPGKALEGPAEQKQAVREAEQDRQPTVQQF